MLVRFPSLETRWLQRSEKWLSQPQVAFVDTYCYFSRYGHFVHSCYCPKQNETVLLDGKKELYVGHRPLIVVNIKANPDTISSTLAHEWRHHWQHEKGYKTKPIKIDTSEEYETRIKRYYTESWSEADALWFELQKTRDEFNDYWLKLILEHKPTLRYHVKTVYSF